MTGDPFAHDDGVYVLGALDAPERAEFEAHLATCAACRGRVAEVAPMATLLAGLSEADFAADDPGAAGAVPDTLLPGLLRRAQREHSRRRLLGGSIGAVAAACLVALAIVVWPTSPATRNPQALTAVRPSPVSATAVLVSKGWGTEIDVKCRYAEEVEGGRPYDLQVIDTAGEQHAAGSWTLASGHSISFTGGTEVPRDHIAKVQITLADGTPILQLKL